MWIDNTEYRVIGTIRYLVRTMNTSNGSERYSLRERPLRTNGNHVPRLNGWCGETDNLSRTACGLWRITGFNRDRERVRIERVSDRAEQIAFLEGDGYPELATDCEVTS